MATRKKKNNIGAFGHPIYGKGFAKYGEMRPNGSSEIPNDQDEELKKAAEEFEINNTGIYPEVGETSIYDAFIAGANWQKEQDNYDTIFHKGMMYYRKQMMKEAVEGTIICQNLNRYILVPGLDESLIYGDKVRIIIVKED